MYKKHGFYHIPLYKIYMGIIRRCEDVKSPSFSRYGARGVHMCEEWRDNFEVFQKWAVDNGWKKGLFIDKDIIPRKLGIPALVYSPKMCSVVTHKENANCASNNIIVEYLGKTQTLSQWAEELNLDYRFVWQRIKLGWSPQKALSTPKRTLDDINISRRKPILNTETGIFYFGAKEAADIVGISISYMNQKLTGRQPNNTSFTYV